MESNDMQYNAVQNNTMPNNPLQGNPMQYNTMRPVWTPVYEPSANPHKAENLFKPSIADFLFALTVFVLGYIFARWILFDWQGWGVTVFTTAYLLAVSVYLQKKGVHTGSLASWFWMIVTWATGVSYALWGNAGFAAIRGLFLFGSAVYFVIAASGCALMGKTGNFLVVDGFRMLVLVPFRNFFNQYISFSALRIGQKRVKLLPVFLGAIFALILLAILIPMLVRADSGGFQVILRSVSSLFTYRAWDFAMYAVISIPISAYLYGLVSGAAHRKGTDIIKPEVAGRAVAGLRIFHPATVYIALGAVCGLYLVFILSQAPYFFSAFTGRRPEGWLVYAEYARQGFFELCGIGAINLVILTVCNLTCRKHRHESRPLMIFNIALAVITLALIATAFSKMALYISVYGLTMPRLLPCVFMVFMAFVFVALIVLQKKSFSIVRFALVTGASMLCLLCLLNPDAMVVRYNADRYMSGTLREFDTEILYRSGSAGVLPAIEVYETTKDEELKQDIALYLIIHAGNTSSRHLDNLELWQARTAGEGVRPELLQNRQSGGR